MDRFQEENRNFKIVGECSNIKCKKDLYENDEVIELNELKLCSEECYLAESIKLLTPRKGIVDETGEIVYELPM